jgi:drug/metabolite transporter (DMT)-like permease
MPEHTSFPTGEAAALLAAGIWAFTSLTFTHASRRATPVAINTFKLVAASLFYAVVLAARHHGIPWDPRVAGPDVAFLVLSGLLGLSFGDSMLFKSFQALGTRRAQLVFSLNPLLGAAGGVIFLHERLDARSMLGMALALGGVAWVIGERRVGAVGSAGMAPVSGMARALPDRRTVAGVFYGLGAAMGQAAGALVAKSTLVRVDTVSATQIRVTAGAAGLLLLAAAGGRVKGWGRLIARERLVPQLVAASFFGPFIGIFLMFVALDRTTTGIALTLLSTTPIWLIPLGARFGGDPVTSREVAGIVVALSGVAVLLLR